MKAGNRTDEVSSKHRFKIRNKETGKSLENKKTHSPVLKKLETIRFIVAIFTLFFLKLSFSLTSSKSI